jgi:PAS domain S-box-containing protein
MDNVQRETLISGNEDKEIDLLVTDINIKPIIKKVRHFALINEENKFCYVNRRFCQLFGYQRNEIINQHIYDLYGELTESSPKEKISKGLTSHKEKSTSLILYRKDGTALEVFVRLSPLKRDPDAVAFHLLTVIPSQLPSDYDLFSPSSPNMRSPSKIRSATSVQPQNVPDTNGEVVISLQRTIKMEDISPMDLEWDISYGVDIKLPKETRCGKSRTMHRKILHSVRACAKPGELLAIMGPTGCGKTTLLNILAQRVKKGVKGQLYASGEAPNKNYKRKVGYVLQSDIFFENLTVEQTLNFQAALRLPAELTDQQRKTKVGEVMEILNITKTRNTIIGGYARRGISGGEKKRVNIGNQLLTNPSVLFLDEPTTGLDTSTALSLMLTLKEMARAGMTIVATIHQPSSQIFEQFDKLLLMVDGNSVYFGAANEAINYFSSIGLKCPKNYNPADFMMGVVLEEEIKHEDTMKKKIIKDWQEYQSDNKKHEKQFKYLQHDTNGVDSEDSSDVESKQKQKIKKDYARSWGDQFKTLWTRAMIQSKGVYFETMQYIQLALVVFIVSILWLQTPAREDRINDIIGVMFFLAIYNIGFFPMLCSLFNFPPERDVIIRERSEGAYYLSAYFAAKALSDMPFLILYPFAYSIPTYFLVGLAYDAGKFFYFLLLIMVGALTATGFGLMFSAGFPDVRKSQVFATVAMLFILLAGGFYIDMALIPAWINWLQYLSYLKYALDSLIISQFSGSTFEQTSLVTQFDGYDPIPGELVIASRSLTVPSMWGSFGVVIGWGIAFWTVAYVLLRNSLKQRN